jgi:hypothetical protein
MNLGIGASGSSALGQGGVAAVGNGGSGSGAQPGGGGSLAGSGGVAAVGGGGSGGTIGGAGTGGSAGPVNDPNTVTISMGTFMVPAGAEVFMCQDFDNPFGGQDVAIGSVSSDMTPGSHHLHVFYDKGVPASPTVTTCANPFEFRSLLFASGTPHAEQAYPAGMASKLHGTTGLRLQVHYLNLTDQALPVNVTVHLTKVDPSTVQKWIAELYFNRAQMSVPPGMGKTVTTTCTIPATYGPIGLISAGSHMHKRGVKFVASTVPVSGTGVKLLETTEWDEPPGVTYDPPVMLNPGDKITWTCTYDNNTDSTLTFGDSAEKNEMCIYLARFFSSPDGQHIECQALGPNG